MLLGNATQNGKGLEDSKIALFINSRNKTSFKIIPDEVLFLLGKLILKK